MASPTPIPEFIVFNIVKKKVSVFLSVDLETHVVKMKRTSTSSIPKPSSTSTRQSLGPLRVRDENRNSGIGATGTRGEI